MRRLAKGGEPHAARGYSRALAVSVDPNRRAMRVRNQPISLREVLASNLRRLRRAKGLSQIPVAYDAGVSRAYLSRLENGSFNASLDTIGKLAAV